MPTRVPRTRAQLVAFRAQRLTDPLNQQNTAARVREVAEEEAFAAFNRAEDQLGIGQVIGLAEALLKPLPALQTFRFRTQAEAAANYGGQTLDQLDYATAFLHARVFVEFWRDNPADTTEAYRNENLLFIYDKQADAQHQGWRTSGAPAINDARAGLKLVKLTDPAATGVLAYAASDTTITAAGVPRYYDAADGQGVLFYASTEPLPAPVPAPTGRTDAHWRLITPPPVPGGTPGTGSAGTGTPAAPLPPVTFTNQTSVLVAHNLGYTPMTQLYDSTGDGFDSPAHEVDANTLRFDFSLPMSGKVIFGGGGGSSSTSAAVDAYTKSQADALAATAAQAAANATDAQKQRIDAMLAGANGAVDTFIEAYNRFVADENAAAALNGQLSALQTLTATHTQQITALQAAGGGGRFRGAFVPSTASTPGTDYKQYDTVLQNNILYYALAAFTSGAAFDASKWVVLDAVLSPDQVASLLPLVKPIQVNGPNGSLGFDTLDAALANTTIGYSLQINASVVNLAASNSVRGSQPGIITSASYATINVPDGVSLTVKAELRNLSVTANGVNRTGSVAILSGNAGTPDAITGPQFFNSVIPALVLTAGQYCTLRDTQAGRLTGNGTVYLYGTSTYDGADAGIVVVDRRPTSGPAAPPAQADTTTLRVTAGSGNGNNTTSLPASGWRTVAFDAVAQDAGGNWNPGTNYYTVPIGGIYVITTKFRMADANSGGPAAGQSYAQGPNVGNQDDAHVMWFVTAPVRNGSLNIWTVYLQAGKQVRLITYLDSFSNAAYAAEMSIRRVG